jgi:hypothetical protein
MIAPFLAALLLAATAAQTPPPAGTPAERARAAVAELEQAFAKADAGPRLRAIESAAEVPGADVARGIARGLGDRDLAVQRAAIDALRFHPDPRAFEELLARAKTKAARADATLYALLLRAVGQHGDPRAIELLSENPWSAPDAQVIQARILGLGRIRTPAALDALQGLLQIAGPLKTQPFMKDFRLALWSLTGTDQGESQELWLRWLRANKKTAIAKEAPAEPRELARRWTATWAKPDAAADREGRGDSGEGRRQGRGEGRGGGRDGKQDGTR